MKRHFWPLGIGIIATAIFLGSVKASGGPPLPVKYHSEVAQNDCSLCGMSNPFRGVDALLFVVVREKSFDVDNVGMIRYCQKDSPSVNGCELEMLSDESLTAEESAHKKAPFSINGILKPHNIGEFTITHYLNLYGENHGVTGTLSIYSKNRLITGTLEISKCKGANPSFLCTALCQKCFDKVYPITRQNNFFFLDTLTEEVYSIFNQEKNYFDMRNYHIHIQLQNTDYLVFYIICSVQE